MPDVRYEVLVNRQLKCTSGIDGLGGVLTAMLTWVKRECQQDDEVSEDEQIIESHWFKVGGIDPLTDDHVQWYEEPVEPGDEITIRILGPGPADEPVERYKFGK